MHPTARPVDKRIIPPSAVGVIARQDGEAHVERRAGQLARVGSAFERCFDRSPRFATCAPGRVNLIGEHTDYSEGFVLPIAMQREVVIVADQADADVSTLLAVDLEERATVDFTMPLSPVDEPRWVNYPLGVVSQFVQRGTPVPNLDLALVSDVPIGAGLSSSAAVEVATATLLERVVDVALDPVEKALLCQRAEHSFPGTPCGIMDMFIATMAEPDHALLIDCRSNSARAVPMPPSSEAVILVINTGVKHDLASSEYAERRATCQRVSNRLGIRALRDATAEALERAELTQREHQRASHVVLENKRTLEAAARLERGDIAGFGELMFQSHESLRYLYEVSCPELDLIVDTARSMRGPAGVLGARMTGGGFGGCAIVLCRSDTATAVGDRLRAAFHAAFHRDPTIFATGAASGTRTLDPV